MATGSERTTPVIVTVSDERLNDIKEVADQLVARGMRVERVLPVTGVISGSVASFQLAALREVEFDRATGKLSDADYAFLKARYTKDAVAALRADDASSAGSDIETMIAARARALAGGAPACPTCGPRPEADAVFCSTCGLRLSMT